MPLDFACPKDTQIVLVMVTLSFSMTDKITQFERAKESGHYQSKNKSKGLTVD